MQYLHATLKMTEWSVCFQSNPFNITVIQLYAPTTDLEEAEVDKFYEDLDLLELIAKKKTCPIYHRGLEGKSRKSRDSGTNRQVWTQSTKWSGAIANIIFQQYKRWLYTWISPNGHTEIRLITFFVDKDGALYRQQKQDLELTVGQIIITAKIRLKLKKAGKTTRPVRYDLNKTPHKYTVEMMNRIKGLDLVNRVPEELRTEVHHIVKEAANNTIPKKKKCKKTK